MPAQNDDLIRTSGCHERVLTGSEVLQSDEVPLGLNFETQPVELLLKGQVLNRIQELRLVVVPATKDDSIGRCSAAAVRSPGNDQHGLLLVCYPLSSPSVEHEHIWAGLDVVVVATC